MKITIQEKIAELEARIVVLEKNQRRPHLVNTEDERIFGEDWRLMWKHFNEVMKRAFGS